jgi:hypothetical protein
MPNIYLTPYELDLLKMLLDDYGESLSRRGCNDFTLPDKTGRALFEEDFMTHDMEANAGNYQNPGDERQQRSRLKRGIIMDFEVLHYIESLLEKESQE